MLTFNWNIEAMSPSQFKIADYIEKNLQQVLLSTEQEVADAVKVSIASVSRFWRTVGYKNMKEFKSSMVSQLQASPAGKMKKGISMVENTQAFPYHTLTSSTHHLYKTIEQYEEEVFQKAIQAMVSAKSIYLYCPGPSLGLGELMKYRMSRYGIDIRILNKAGSEILEDVIHFTKEDALIVFGFIRLLKEAQVLLDYAKQIGYKTIIITDQLVSGFSTKADLVLFASRGDIREFHSMIGPTFLIENIILAVGAKNEKESVQRLERISELRGRYGHLLPR
ncbi:MurR/RpiR family transcriptional regulator [Bacillus sp. B1-b2]|uniref:MurR/RpiR family transcriptional regulator n=1 Tax=Bacillus sp. B1-b2 TaxID=2653201 RepID=UPI0012618637|nr:MurR/RpiR family transcriptional regulator [Bacillus sp. B1-b2]KAB7664923.1 MurR/RpiR family transcriptional regulator [Bacillus sp. B1-b2]